MQTAEAAAAEAQAAHEAAQRTLRGARCVLEKRIHEHDTCVEERKAHSLVQVTLQMVKEQEAVVAAAAAGAQVGFYRCALFLVVCAEAAAAAARACCFLLCLHPCQLGHTRLVLQDLVVPGTRVNEADTLEDLLFLLLCVTKQSYSHDHGKQGGSDRA